MTLRASWVSIIFVGVLTPGWAGAAEEGGAGHHHHGPPPEALSACEGAARGASCSFTMDDRTIKGVCQSPDDSKPLACMPNDRPPPGPPPEALKACSGAKRGAACQLPARDGSGRTMAGTCDSPDDDKPLACRPNDRPAPPPR